MGKGFFKFKFLGTAAVLAALAGFSAAAMFLWNALMPDIFGLPSITYWQAAGILVLARILLGGLGPGHFNRGRHSCGREDFLHGNKLREKWMSMNDEERKNFWRSHARFSHLREFFDSEETAPASDGKSNE